LVKFNFIALPLFLKDSGFETHVLTDAKQKTRLYEEWGFGIQCVATSRLRVVFMGFFP